jgi:hypothetical protein
MGIWKLYYFNIISKQTWCTDKEVAKHWSLIESRNSFRKPSIIMKRKQGEDALRKMQVAKERESV